MALIVQATIYAEGSALKLPKPYKTWTAKHLAESVFKGIAGDLKVKDDIN